MSITRTYRIKNDILYIMSFSLLLVLLIALGDKILIHYARITLGLPFVLFFPGYILIAALFPRRADLDGIERVALSVGLSIPVVPLIGLGLNYTPWGIRLVPILISLIVFLFAMSAITLYRRGKILEEERFIPTLEIALPSFKEMSKVDRLLSVILVLSILFAVGSIVYMIAVPKTGEKFTEFYILGPGDKAEGYPTDINVGKKGQVSVGVVNHEYAMVNYTVYVKIGNAVKSTIGPIALSNEQKWEHPVEFSADKPGQNQKVEFLLYREGDTAPYRSLHIWVNVKALPSTGATE